MTAAMPKVTANVIHEDRCESGRDDKSAAIIHSDCSGAANISFLESQKPSVIIKGK